MKHFEENICPLGIRLRVGVVNLLVAVIVSACGGSGKVSQASASGVTVANGQPGVTPFIASIRLNGKGLENLTSIRYTIASKPGAASKPVKVQYSADALRQRGYMTTLSSSATLPVFGLYAGYLNHVAIELAFADTSTQTLEIDIATASYSDPNQIYDQPTILKSRAPSASLGFDFMFIKSQFGTPVVIDTDAQIRWVGPSTGYSNSASQAFIGSSFLVLHRFHCDFSLTPAESSFSN